jgi:hypothetical protein
MSNLRKAIIITAIPIVVLSLVSLGSKHADLNKGLGIAWLVAGDLWLIALITAIVLSFKKSKEIVSGILIGLAIGAFSLGVTMIILIAMHQPG